MTQEEFESIGKQLASMSFVQKNTAVNGRYGIRYLKYRLMRPVFKAKYRSFQKKNPEAPWLSPGSIFVLKKILTKGMRGFEFGSGRSTIFYAQLLDRIDSVEHYRDWYHKVEEMLHAKAIENTNLMLIEPESDVPSQHLSSEEQLWFTEEEYPIKDEVFEAYINSLDNYPNEHFDFIAVDGRARKSCMLRSIDKLKPGGFLLLDNSERRRYQKAINAVADWPRIFTTTGLTDTSIWMKP